MMDLYFEEQSATLKPGVSSDHQVTSWLSHLNRELGLPVRRVNERHWQIDLRNAEADFVMDIKDQDPWITYGAELMPDVTGKAQKRADFYGAALDLNGQLNGAKIARNGSSITVTREDPKAEVSQARLYSSIAVTNNAVEAVTPILFSEIGDLKLRK